jgi:hypothetical protein
VFTSGWDLADPERKKIDLVKRYGVDCHPVRLTNTASDQICFFLDCRFLGFTGRCEGGHDVNAMNTQYSPSLVKVENNKIVAAFEWLDDPQKGSMVPFRSLGRDSEMWHSINLDSFVEFLCSRNQLSENCKHEIKVLLNEIVIKLKAA